MRTLRAHSVHSRDTRRHFRGTRGTQRRTAGRLMELPRSYVTPSCGDSWPHCHSIRSACGSTVLRGSGPTTFSLTGRERCRKGYVFFCAVTPPKGEGPGGAGRRPYGSDTPFRPLANTTLPLPRRLPRRAPRAQHTHVKLHTRWPLYTSEGKKVTARQTTTQE